MLFQRLLRRFFSALLEGVSPDFCALLRAPVEFGNFARRSVDQICPCGAAV